MATMLAAIGTFRLLLAATWQPGSYCLALPVATAGCRWLPRGNPVV